MGKRCALLWTLLIGSASAIRLIFIINACLYLDQLEGHIQYSPPAPFQVVHIRAHNATSWSLPGIYIWSPLSYALRISSVYAILHFSVFLTTIPTTFQDVYHDRVGIAGLHYLALGFGLSVPLQINAMLMDKIYTLLKARNGGVGRPEFRLREYRS
jgi:hypothetical protein